MTRTTLVLHTPSDFDFMSTVYSHGWCTLPPFALRQSPMALERLFTLSSGTAVLCTFTERSQSLHARCVSARVLSAQERSELRTLAKRCFRLDEDLSSFHGMLQGVRQLQWIARRRAGRLLRGPTVFEDVVKTICTTNCSWALTTAMVTNLCRVLGEPFDGGQFSFPTPGSLAASTESVLRTRVKAGYRAPFLLEFARAIDRGSLDPERWRDPLLSVNELYLELKKIKGIGDYAAGNILKLLGHYDYLGLDSWVRAQYYRLHHGGRTVKDATIERRYASFGRWRGLVFWLEMTQHWYDEKFPLAP